MWILRAWSIGDPVRFLKRYWSHLRRGFMLWAERTGTEAIATVPEKLGAPKACQSDRRIAAHLAPAPPVAPSIAADALAVCAAVCVAVCALSQRVRGHAPSYAEQELTGQAAARLGPKAYGRYGAAVYLSKLCTAAGASEEWPAWAEAAVGDALDCAGEFGHHSCRSGCWRKRARIGIVCRGGYYHLEPGDKGGWNVVCGRALVGDPRRELIAEVDVGERAGGQDEGAIRRVRVQRWEIKGNFMFFVGCRCNHDTGRSETKSIGTLRPLPSNMAPAGCLPGGTRLWQKCTSTPDP